MPSFHNDDDEEGSPDPSSFSTPPPPPPEDADHRPHPHDDDDDDTPGGNHHEGQHDVNPQMTTTTSTGTPERDAVAVDARQRPSSSSSSSSRRLHVTAESDGSWHFTSPAQEAGDTEAEAAGTTRPSPRLRVVSTRDGRIVFAPAAPSSATATTTSTDDPTPSAAATYNGHGNHDGTHDDETVVVAEATPPSPDDNNTTNDEDNAVSRMPQRRRQQPDDDDGTTPRVAHSARDDGGAVRVVVPLRRRRRRRRPSPREEHAAAAAAAGDNDNTNNDENNNRPRVRRVMMHVGGRRGGGDDDAPPPRHQDNHHHPQPSEVPPPDVARIFDHPVFNAEAARRRALVAQHQVQSQQQQQRDDQQQREPHDTDNPAQEEQQEGEAQHAPGQTRAQRMRAVELQRRRRMGHINSPRRIELRFGGGPPNGNNVNHNNDNENVLPAPPPVARPLPDGQQELRPTPDALRDVPRCSVCWEYLAADVRSCPNARCTARFCGSCTDRHLASALQREEDPNSNAAGATCPVCRSSSSTTSSSSSSSPSFGRDHALERRLQETVPPVPCRYSGCDETLPLARLEAHEEQCPFQRVTCRYGAVGCPWKGRRRDVTAHEEGGECRLHPLRDFLARQRQTHAAWDQRVRPLTHQLTASRQHGMILEHRLHHLGERLRDQDARLRQLERATTTGGGGIPGRPVAAPPHTAPRQVPVSAPPPAFDWNRPYASAKSVLQHAVRELSQMILFWVSAIRHPQLLLQQSTRCARAMATWGSLPTLIVAFCTYADIAIASVTSLSDFDPLDSDRYSDLLVSPLLSLFFLFLCMVPAGRLASHPLFVFVQSWTIWSIALWWYRHTDQCLSIWLTSMLATFLGCALLGHARRSEQGRLVDVRAWSTVLAWLVVSCGLTDAVVLTCWVTTTFFAGHVLRRRWTNRWISGFVGLVLYSLVLLIGLPHNEALPVFLVLLFLLEAIRFMAMRIGDRVRARPRKVAVLLVSLVVLVLLSWSIADCLYHPLQYVLDTIIDLLSGVITDTTDASDGVAPDASGNASLST